MLTHPTTLTPSHIPLYSPTHPHYTHIPTHAHYTHTLTHPYYTHTFTHPTTLTYPHTPTTLRPSHIHYITYMYSQNYTAECDPRHEDTSPSDSSTNAIPSHDPEPADTVLRSRFNPSSISQTHSTQTDSGGGYADSDGGTDGSGAVSLRLIMSENSLTVTVSPSCTLGELRRYLISNYQD